MNIDEICTAEFPLDEDLIYLNHAAVSPWPQRTVKAVIDFASENGRKGAQNYPVWLEVEARLRKQLQDLINAPSVDDIALLKNTSEALSVVAEGLDWRPGDNVVSSNEEFPSNRIPWLAQAQKGVEFRETAIDRAEPEQALIEACDEHTRLLTVSSVQYGSGRRLDLKKLGNFCKENNILFCIDAIQSLGVLALDVQSINADFVMADAHKWLLGPEGIALFFSAKPARELLSLHQFGWRMVEDMGNYDKKDWAMANSSRRFECGSPNMSGIHALSASLSLFEQIGMQNITRIIIKNTKYIIDYIDNINNTSLLSSALDTQLSGIVTFKINGKDSNAIHRKLLNNKVICAHRMGGIRFSPHFYTTKNNINKSLEILSSII